MRFFAPFRTLSTTTALIVSLAAPTAVGLFPTASAAETGRWQTSGRWITDEQGRAVITVGVNQVAKTAPYTHEAAHFDEADVAFLAEQGFTSVRLGVIWKAVEPAPGQYD